MNKIGIGLIGTGFMGKAHAFGYRAAAVTFPGLPEVDLVAIADVNAASAATAAKQYGFRKSTGNWKDLLADPEINVISITTPNALHKDMALAAIAAGKHVHCEKPLAPVVADAVQMMAAAEQKGTITQVGYNYIKNPVLKRAREMIEAGELGTIYDFRGIHAEDYMADPEGPYSWRLDPSGGPGVIADLGSHIIGMARFLLGPITDVTADVETVITSRPVPGTAERKTVVADDIARMLIRFGRGCGGSIEASWVSTGRKMQLEFEIYGSKGSLLFTQERFNELHFFKAADDRRYAGFTKIESGPQYAPYLNFCVAQGHQLGFNDLKTIEMAEFLAAIAAGQKSSPDFREAVEIQKVVDAAIRASKARSWMKI